MKYVESEFPRYMVFGEFEDGRVCVEDHSGQHIAIVTRAEAEQLIADRDRIIDRMYEMARSFNSADRDAFVAFWYGKSP